MPGYGLLPAEEGEGLLPWSWATERLSSSHNYWLATARRNGRPHLMAVWGVWIEDAFYFSTGAETRKARNLAFINHCCVSTADAGEAVIVEGAAERIAPGEGPERVRRRYEEKYGQAPPADSPIFRVVPSVVFGFIEREDRFRGAATRWELAP